VADSVSPASQAATLTSQGRELKPVTIFEPSMAQPVDEFKLPPRLNLRESALCRQSECVKALQQKAHEPAHVAWGTKIKRSVSALITLFSFVSHVTVPDHELPTHATFSDHMIKHFEHYNGTINQIHLLSFSTDVSSNEVFTYKEAMTQEDAHLFIEVMQKKKWMTMYCNIIGQ
jgi:hypothetical protein